MPRLNLPTPAAKIRMADVGKQIWDVARKQYVALTPEEWVRQHVVHFLIAEKNYPASLISVEMGLKLHGMQRRCDIVIFNHTGNPIFVVECKAPEVKIDQKVFDQIAQYNLVLKVPYLLVTNGMRHYCCELDHQTEAWHFLEEIPTWEQLQS